MANQSFTNAPISDKKFVEIKEDPKAPTSKASNDSAGNQLDPNELSEILFQAENVLTTDKNPTLSILDDVDGNVRTPPPNTPTDDAQHVTRDKEPKSKDKIVKRREANKVYGATHRAKKLARIKELQKQIENLQMEKEKIQSQLADVESSCTGIRQEIAKMKAYCDIMVRHCDHQDAVNEALLWMINWLRSKILYY